MGSIKFLLVARSEGIPLGYVGVTGVIMGLPFIEPNR